jgi:nitroimidazol reductase NimA-like FMN-containing flavoprotein (pyridoxamine 5'-phosphate oxidase superfamily)
MDRNETAFDGVNRDPPANPGDIGRRVAMRREQLGLTREQVAARAGMSPEYLQYVEEKVADASTISLIRLAGALDTTLAELRGGGTDLPSGTAKAAPHPQLQDMSPEECRDRMSTHGVGRVGVTMAAGPVIVPVNYSVVDDAIVYRTAPGTPAAAPDGTEVAFEVDHIDEAQSQGWSVLVMGRAQQVTDPLSARRLAERAYSRPWAGGDRDLWIRIEPVQVTGRRISVVG